MCSIGWMMMGKIIAVHDASVCVEWRMDEDCSGDERRSDYSSLRETSIRIWITTMQTSSLDCRYIYTRTRMKTKVFRLL